MKLRTTPFWLDRHPSSRTRRFPPLRGDLQTRVAIVGGGLAGCACAYAFAAAGIPVALLEADGIGAGATAADPGLVREEFDASFAEAASAYGVRAARAMWQDVRRASLDFAAVLRRLRVRCELQPQDLLRITPRDPAEVKRWRREYRARREAGLSDTWNTAAALARETRVEAGGALRTHAFGLDPYRACLGLSAAAIARGAQVFERSPVVRLRSRRRDVEVAVERGTVQADAVIVATSAPIRDLRPLRRHLHPRQAYAVVTAALPANVRRELGTRSAALQDRGDPPHLLRWLKDDRVLFAGAAQDPVPGRALDRVLVQRAGQLMYELSTIYPAISGAPAEWVWPIDFHETADGLPCIGTHRNFPRHLFALGLGRHGAGAAWLGARTLLRSYTGEPARTDHLLSFSRIL